MRLQRLVEVSGQVAATSSRLAKRDLIAGLLRETPPEELEVATAYLSGVLVQRRTGVGWRGLADLPEPAAEPRLELADIDRALERLQALAGPGSGSARRAAVRELFGALTAPEQDYLRGLMTGNLRQGAQDSVVLDAIAEASGIRPAVVRRAAMFSAPTGPVAHAALTGGEEALARFDLEVGRPVRPMLAAAAPDVAAGVDKLGGGDFAVDTKLDGIRIQVHKRRDDVTVFTRSLEEIGERLPGVTARVRALPARDLVLDGEALALDGEGRPRPFQETASQLPGVELQPFFFDLLLHDEERFITRPLADRLDRLDEIVPEQLRVRRLVTGSPEQAEAFFHDTVGAGQEGVVLKRLDAAYDAGRRGSAWVKVKPRHTLDLVVLAVEWGSGRRRGWLSNIHLGARSDDGAGFVMLGKTFKGMTDEMLAWQTERFLSLETGRDGHVVRLRPEQVVEVAFDGVQRSSRYPGGVALRFARVLRYRDDKRAEEADTLAAVQELM
jgi:DNA ligase-1